MVVTRLLPIRNRLIIRAAIKSSRRVFSIRFGLSTSGITATPVSNPERPRASLGKTSSDRPMTIRRLRGSVTPAIVLVENREADQFDIAPGF